MRELSIVASSTSPDEAWRKSDQPNLCLSLCSSILVKVHVIASTKRAIMDENFYLSSKTDKCKVYRDIIFRFYSRSQTLIDGREAHVRCDIHVCQNYKQNNAFVFFLRTKQTFQPYLYMYKIEM